MSEQVSGNPAGVRANRAASSFGVVVGRVHAPHQPPVSPQVLRAGGEFEVVAVSDDAESSTPIPYPGHTGDMQVASRAEMPDYVGRGMLDGKRALITGDDSGIGPAVAVAFAKEGADVASAFFEEDNDAALTRARVEKAGRPCVLLRGDLAHPEHCRAVVAHTVEARGGLDVPVNNLAYQQPNDDFTDQRRAVAAYFRGERRQFLPCHHGGVGASARRCRDHQYEFDQRTACAAKTP